MPVKLLFQRPGYMSDRPVTEDEVAHWTGQHGATLPADYMRFITGYNGGTVKPYVFPQQHPWFTDDDSLMTLEELYDWETVLETSDFDVPQERRHLPPGFLAIGADLGERAYVIMCVKDGLIGQIFVVEKRRWGIWGFEGHDVLGHVSDSFTGFLALLRDADEASFYHGYWTDGNPDLNTAVAIEL